MASLIDRIQNAMLGGAGADKMRELLIELNIPLGGSGENAMRDIRKSILFSTDSEDELRTGMGNLGLTGVATGVRPMPRIRAAILHNRSDSETQLRAAIDDLLDEAEAPTDIALSNSTVAEDVALGTLVGALSAIDPEMGVVTFSLTDDSDGYFAISGSNLIVARVLDFEAAPSHSITVRATDESALTYDEPFTITVTNVTEPSTGDDPPPTDGEIVHDNTFDNPPIVTEVGGTIKLHGNKGSGSTGKFIYNIGPFLPGYRYTMSYEPDFALLTLQGKKAMVGFGLKSGNDFRLTGLKGDGSTGLKAYEISGDGLWSATSGFTETDGGAAQHGTQAGPNWLQIEISEDGLTYTQRTSTNGETWADEFTDVVPTPFADVEEATQGGIAVFFDGTDTGSFSVAVTLWIAEPAGDPHWANVVLLLGFEGADASTTTTDESNASHAMTFRGTSQIDTAQFKFGTSSLLCQGNANFIDTPDSADWSLTGTFTIEYYFRYTTASAVFQATIAQWGGAGLSFLAGVIPDTTIQYVGMAVSTDGVGVAFRSPALGTDCDYTTNTWVHVAYDRDSSNVLRCYVNGVMKGKTTGASGWNNSLAKLSIGADEQGNNGFTGWMDEIRITKGVSRYGDTAGDGGFTPPAESFPRG